MQIKNILLYLFLGLFHSFILIVQLKIDRKCGEKKGGMTCIKGPKVRFAQPSNSFFVLNVKDLMFFPQILKTFKVFKHPWEP